LDGPRYLGWIQFPFYLRKEEGDMGDHKKKESYRGATGAMKLPYVPQYDRFMGMRGMVLVSKKAIGKSVSFLVAKKIKSIFVEFLQQFPKSRF
jgi:hypothetical protein